MKLIFVNSVSNGTPRSRKIPRLILISDYYSKSCGGDFSFWQGEDPQACWMQVKGLQRNQGEKALHRIAGLI